MRSDSGRLALLSDDEDDEEIDRQVRSLFASGCRRESPQEVGSSRIERLKMMALEMGQHVTEWRIWLNQAVFGQQAISLNDNEVWTIRSGIVVPLMRQEMWVKATVLGALVLIFGATIWILVQRFFGRQEEFFCDSCLVILGKLKSIARWKPELLPAVFTSFCITMKMETPDVCRGAVGPQADILVHDFIHMDPQSRTAKLFCSHIFGMCPLPEPIEMTLPLSKKPETSLLPSRRTPYKQRLFQRPKTPLKVVHISDVHIDRAYKAGTSANCNKPICCREGPLVEKDAAGPYGNIRCDAPPALIQSAMEGIEAVAGDREFTIFTGDVIESAVWSLDQEAVTKELSEYFDGLNEEKFIYPVIGNHDVDPVNSFPRKESFPILPKRKMPNITSQWVYDLTGGLWESWIGFEASQQVRHASGCYARVHPNTNLMIISINTQYWYKGNFWLYDQAAPSWDPNGVLSFLTQALDTAERRGYRAWILGHMSFGKLDAMRDQSNYANQIFQRYSHVIAAHFYGHSHVDEWEIGYTDYSKREHENANMMSYIAGSITPISGNPRFRVYEVDPDTYEVMDFVIYYANMTDPSFQQEPRWTKYYSARELYGGLVGGIPETSALTPAFWHNVTRVLEDDVHEFNKYNERLTAGGKIVPCSAHCRQVSLCLMRTMRSQDNCIQVRPGLTFKTKDPVTSISESADETHDALVKGSEGVPVPHVHIPVSGLTNCQGFGVQTILGKLGFALRNASVDIESVTSLLSKYGVMGGTNDRNGE